MSEANLLEQDVRVVFMDVEVKLEDILKNKLTPPLDLASFRAFCAQNLCQENLDFVIACEEILAEEVDVTVSRTAFDELYAKFLSEDAAEWVNLSSETLKELQEFLPKLESSHKFEIQDMTRKPYKEIKNLLQMDTLVNYLNSILLKKKLAISKKIALWWSEPLTVREFFTFPDPINDAESRIHAFCCICLMILNAFIYWYFDFPFIGVFIAYGYLARTTSGPRLDPQAYVVLFILRPLFEDVLKLISSKYVPGNARRLAQFIGATFSVTATILSLLNFRYASLAVWGVLFFASSLHSFLNFCIACYLYNFLVKLKIIPALRCEECEVRVKYVTKRDVDTVRKLHC